MDQIKDHSYQEKGEFSLSMRMLNKDGVLCKEGDLVDNPRLLLNMPAGVMMMEITDSKPPYLVVVCRADQEVQGLGLLEKTKDMLKSFTATMNPVRNELVRGVKEASAILAAKGKPS